MTGLINGKKSDEEANNNRITSRVEDTLVSSKIAFFSLTVYDLYFPMNY